jgi:hypothetical protein
MLHRLLLATVFTWGLCATPAQAQRFPVAAGPSVMEQAAQRVHTYLSSIPGLPKNLLVVPAAGEVIWPGLPANNNARAEVWLVVSRDDPAARPLMMFAVRPTTGEVYAMFLVDTQKNPVYR